MKNKLFKNEQIIGDSGSTKSGLILTNLRVHYSVETLGSKYFISIFYNNISSIEKKYKSYILLLIIGCVLFLGGIYSINIEPQIATMPIIVGVILIVLYFFTRYNVIAISSKGGSVMSFKTSGMSEEKIFEMINTIELQIYNNIVICTDVSQTQSSFNLTSEVPEIKSNFKNDISKDDLFK